MKAQTIVSTKSYKEEPRLVMSSSLIVAIVGVYIFFYYPQSYAVSWTFNPTLQAQEIYSDNIRLSSTDKQSAFVTSLTPGFSILGQSPRSRLNFIYRMQNLYNAGGNNGLSISNQLNSTSHNIFIQNKLFLDTNSSISQQNINNNRIGADNINGSTNTTNVYTFGLSPYWTPHFGNYANGLFRVNLNTIATTANSSSNNTLSDTVNLSETMHLNSGAYFQRVNWNLSFNNNDNYRVNSPNVTFQNVTGRVSVPINQYFNVFAQGGYSINDFQSTNGNNNNNPRPYYTVGGQWKPNQYYSITAGAGNNSYATVYISPMPRLNWTTTYSRNSVGTNFGQYSGGNTGIFGESNPGGNFGQNNGNYGVNGGGNSGENWQTALNYRTRRSTWSLTHINTITTSQQILAENQLLPNQGLLNNPGQNQQGTLDQNQQDVLDQNQLGILDQNQRINNNPILSDSVIFRKTWNFSVSFSTGKSTLNVNAYDQNYNYQGTGINQKVIGVGGAWNWKFASKTSSYIRPQWQYTNNKGSNNNSQFYTVVVGLNQSITNRLNGVLEFRHVNQMSDGNTINLPYSNDYQENRVTASLSMRF